MDETRNLTLEQTYEAEEAVLQNPLLLDKILNFVLVEEEKLHKKNLIAVRRVAKKWLQSASRVIENSSAAAFEIVLEGPKTANQVNGRHCDKTTKELLDKLVSTFGSDSCFQDSLLTLDLTVKPEIFKKANFENFKTFLEKCGNILFNLSAIVLAIGGFMQPEFGEMNLPYLRGIYFFLYTDPKNGQGPTSVATTLAISHFSKFLQIILDGATNLKSYSYLLNDGYAGAGAVNLFNPVKLPKSVTEIISLDSDFMWDYKLLMENFLPNLQEIRMDLFSPPTAEQMFKILDRFKTSLKLFHLIEDVGLGIPTKTFIRFPLMEKLESILIYGENYQLQPNTKGAVSKQLPNLRKLTVDGQKEQNLMEWLKKSKYDNVHTLHLTRNHLNSPNIKSPSFELMRGLKESFPNLCSLNLSFNYEDIDSLKLLFVEWTKLENLHLTFCGNVSVDSTPDLLTSVFLGASKHMIEELRKMSLMSSNKYCPSLDDPEQKLKIQESILNLTELNSLTLELKLMRNLPDRVFKPFLDILPVALNKMANLVNKKLIIGNELKTGQVEYL